MSVQLDPEVQALLDLPGEPPPVPDLPDERSRLDFARTMREWARSEVTRRPRRPFAGVVTDVPVPTRTGSVACRLYRPDVASGAGAVVFLHGGGMIMGDLDSAHHAASELSETAGVAVLSVDYRLAPEHPFPAGPQDAYDTLVWIAEHAVQLGIDPARLGVAGDSAGGLMATAAALQAVGGGPEVRFQLLAYPKVDFEDRYPSMEEFGPLMGPPGLAPFLDACYLPDPARRTDPLASPLRADLHGTPPGLILTAEADALRDEAELYGHRLRLAGAEVTTIRVLGQIHGFLDTTGISCTARRAAQAAYLELGRALSV